MVKINNKALGTFGITSILSFKYNLGSYETVGSSWNVGAIKAVRGLHQETYGTLNTKFLVEGNSKINILKNIALFIEESKSGTFYDDGIYIDVEYTGSTEPQRVTDTMYIIEIPYSILNTYEAERSFPTNKNTILTSNTIKPCMAVVEIVSNATSTISYTFSINDNTIKVKNLTQGKKIIIGNGKILEDNNSKVADVDLLEFPKLKRGDNNITVNRSDVSLTIKYKERI